MGGDGQGDGGSSLMKERSGYLPIAPSDTLSGDDDGTKPSGLLRSEESWILRQEDLYCENIVIMYINLHLTFKNLRYRQWAVYLSSSWLLWGGVGKEAGTSTVLWVWFTTKSPPPFCFRSDELFTEKITKTCTLKKAVPFHLYFYDCVKRCGQKYVNS